MLRLAFANNGEMKITRSHHGVFGHFRPGTGSVPAEFNIDFLGCKTRTAYYAGFTSQPIERREQPEYPTFDEEYFEWIDLLEAVVAAKDKFIFMELGAGWGRWTARGAAAATQLGMSYYLVAVEAEPTHFSWMEQNLRENGVRMENCQLLQAAVTGRDGTVGFHVGDAASSYGQSIGGPVEVPAVSLTTLLEPLEIVDLIDMDVQGAEQELLEAAVAPLQKKVRRVHVETHSRQLHIGVRLLFEKMGWRCHSLFEGNTGDMTPWGRINFQAGVQSWLNPALHTKSQLNDMHTFRNSLGFRGFQAGRKLLDQLAPIGTERRRFVRALLSRFVPSFGRDPKDESLRPTEW